MLIKMELRGLSLNIPSWAYSYKFIRAFPEEDQAKAFIDGRLYCSHILKYRSTNDIREDINEGRASIFKTIHDGVNTFYPLSHSPIVFINPNNKYSNELIRIDYDLDFLNLSVGLFDYEPISGEMYKRYLEFGKYWVIGELAELIQKLQELPEWVCGYRVIYSDSLGGNWVKPLSYKSENEFKFLFINTDNPDNEPKIFNVPSFNSCKLVYK